MRSSRRARVLAIAVFPLLLVLTMAADAALQTADRQRLVVIVDGSGSMWGRVDGAMKIVVAKEVVGDLLAGLPTGIEAGFVAYGHRRKGDCADIEVIAAPGTGREEMLQAVASLTPHGRTPISDALRRAVDVAGDGATTVVLVSDGVETCEGDPCALASALRETNSDLFVHTVGLGVDEGAVRQLRCIAEAGGGHYFHAVDGSALRRALVTVRDAIASGAEIEPPPAAELPDQKEVGTGVIRVAGPGTIELAAADWVEMPPYGWRLVDAETGEQKGASRQERMRVPAGEYQIVWHQAEHLGAPVPLTEVVRVASGETTTVSIDTGLRLILPEGWQPPYRWTLSDPRAGDLGAGFSRTLEPQVVPAGRYDLVWRQTEHGATDVTLGEVEIEAGRLNERVLDSGLVLQMPDWLADGQPHYYALIDADGVQRGRWSERGPQLAPAGDYRLVFRQSEHGHGDIEWATVTIDEHGITEVPVDSGVAIVPRGETPLPYRAFFLDLDSGEEVVWRGRSGRDWHPVVVPPGRYRLDWWEDEHASERMTLIEEFEVVAGNLVRIEL